MKKVNLLIEAVKNIKTVGTISFSSKYLVKRIVAPVDFEKARVIIEFGAGDGSITKGLLKNMHPDCKLLSFEINPQFCEHIRKEIKDPRLILVQDSAEKLSHYIQEHNLDRADYIVSSIPISILPQDVRDKVFLEIEESLGSHGTFVQLQYSLVSKKHYQRIFNKVSYKFVPLSIPPAFIYVCHNRAA